MTGPPVLACQMSVFTRPANGEGLGRHEYAPDIGTSGRGAVAISGEQAAAHAGRGELPHRESETEQHRKVVEVGQWLPTE